MGRFVFVLLILMCCSSSRFTGAYDPIDPNGNITIVWDFQSLDVAGMTPYTVMVSIHNYQMYRHIERPGWRLSWSWAGKEVIWSTTGAETTEQGDCSRVGSGGSRPHCCQKRPVMVDLPPGTPYNMQVANCCRGGVLSSLVQSDLTSAAAFQMVVGEFALARDSGGKEPEKPWQFDMGVPGYTCSNATTVAPTRIKVDKNRYVQALRDLLVLAVPGVGGAVVLRLHDDLLQRDDRRLPAVQLRLPRVPTVATMRQRRSTTTMVAGRRRRRAVVGADRLVLRAHVPDPGALAREDELPQVLAGEGDGVQLQPGEELQRLEPGAAAPQPAEPDAAVQLQLQASRRVRRLQRHGDVLGVTLLQRDAAAGRERAVGDDPGEGERLHLFRWLGVPAEGLLQRPRVRHAAGGPVPRTAQRSLGFAGAFLLPAATLLRCGVDSFASETC
ncbi:uncharacterized protein [Zea mays]|uniref:Uncharacterized protein n=1 Tax=Zea mays TaxID=4577 RepID=A0A804MCI7_MAIZE|nr:uncharacterized protein LOC103646135 isoform X1 [Zea mays]|eukprot:XP_023157538.1 uncharacterized protein LOC103646135 isoform X1 [Zea mays]